jgi:tetratricopeptide (TPR) repeat protein
MKPLCFVLVPFGQKTNPAGGTINFERVYAELIQPAVEAAGLELLRASQEATDGVIHKPAFEQLILCPFAVADLTLAGANVFYELGIRQSYRPWSTVFIVADNHRVTFDARVFCAVPYRLGPDGKPDASQLDQARSAITARLSTARNGARGNPFFQLVEENTPVLVAHEKTDVFQQQVDYSPEIKERLTVARKQGKAVIAAIEQSLGDIAEVESGVVIDLLLAYRDEKAWQEMVDLVPRMAPPLRQALMIQEQLALALNRMGRHDEAEEILNWLIATRGPSSETYALLGRVYKDCWTKAVDAGDAVAARGHIEKAIAAYTAGFETDWRDTLPGINAVTLMTLKDPPDDRRFAMIPVVRYSVQRKVASGRGDYWDYATLIELALLAQDPAKPQEALTQALAQFRASWETESTARNLRTIREFQERRDGSTAWAKEIEDELLKKSGV